MATYVIKIEEKVADECRNPVTFDTYAYYEEAVRQAERLAMGYPAKYDIVLMRYIMYPRIGVEILRLMGEYDG